MISRKLRFLVILVILSSFAEAKDKCPLQCDCSEDLSVVKCRDMEKFPVFNFAEKVKTLDLTYGNIRSINAKEVKPYTNLENLFISHNPLDCDHATTYTLKYVLRETMKLKSFDGHKIKCPKRMPLMGKPLHGLAESGNIHYGGGGPNVHIHALTGHHPLHCMTPGMVATVVFCTIVGLIAVAGICWLIVLLVAAKKKVSNADDPVSQMEDGTSTATQSTDTTAEALMKGLQKQRRSSQGFPENAIVDSEEDDVVEEHEYLMAKMKKQRRHSQGYADGAGSSDEESDMVEINLND